MVISDSLGEAPRVLRDIAQIAVTAQRHVLFKKYPKMFNSKEKTGIQKFRIQAACRHVIYTSTTSSIRSCHQSHLVQRAVGVQQDLGVAINSPVEPVVSVDGLVETDFVGNDEARLCNA